jgi:hypothetical protein
MDEFGINLDLLNPNQDALQIKGSDPKTPRSLAGWFEMLQQKVQRAMRNVYGRSGAEQLS